MRTSGKVLKDFESLRKALFNEEISHIAFMRDGKPEILYTQKYVDKLEQEIERLNNIINELEKELKDYFNRVEINKQYVDSFYSQAVYNDIKHILNKLQELKGDGSNE